MNPTTSTSPIMTLVSHIIWGTATTILLLFFISQMNAAYTVDIGRIEATNIKPHYMTIKAIKQSRSSQPFKILLHSEQNSLLTVLRNQKPPNIKVNDHVLVYNINGETIIPQFDRVVPRIFNPLAFIPIISTTIFGFFAYNRRRRRNEFKN